MKRADIENLKNIFDSISNIQGEENIEFWYARDIMKPLGYSR